MHRRRCRRPKEVKHVFPIIIIIYYHCVRGAKGKKILLFSSLKLHSSLLRHSKCSPRLTVAYIITCITLYYCYTGALIGGLHAPSPSGFRQKSAQSLKTVWTGKRPSNENVLCSSHIPAVYILYIYELRRFPS